MDVVDDGVSKFNCDMLNADRSYRR